MSKLQKASILILVFIFLTPIVTAFCCCVEMPSFAPFSHSHSNYEHHHCEKSEHRQSRDHSDCKHPQIIGNLVNSTVSTCASIASFSVKHLNFLFTDKAVSTTDHFSHPKRIDDTGPPGHSLSIPLYLQISVLRI